MTQHEAAMRPSPREKVDEIPVYSRAKGLGEVTWVASSNESPVPPAPGVVEAIARAAAQGNRYPSMFGDELAEGLARRYAVGVEQIAVGAGSLSLLQQALTAFSGPGANVVYAWRSYEAYPIAVRIAGADPVEIPLTADHVHDLPAMADAVDEHTRAVIVCNPNNPTGTAVPFEEIAAFLRRVPGNVLVILDEAYREFLPAEQDGLQLIDEFPNLMVMRTFSKAYGLAGVRAGYALGNPELMEGVRKVSPPFGLSRLAEAAAVAALADVGHMEHIITTIAEDRDELIAALRSRGLDIPPSSSNFVWIPAGGDAAEQLVSACLDQGVAVRAFPGEGVRITTGEPAASRAFLAAVDAVLPALRGESGPQGTR